LESNSLSSTIERTLLILELFLNQPNGFTAQEMIEKTGISRSTLFSMLKALKDLGYLEQAQNRGPYQVGPKFSAWSGATSPSLQALINSFQQESYSQTFSETIALAVNSPEGQIVLEQVESAQEIRAVYPIRSALRDDSAARLLLSSPTSPAIRETGYALVSNEESYELGLPICADGFTPNAVLLLKAPKFRWKPETLLDSNLDALRAMTARLSYRLGAVTYSPFHPQVSAPIQPTSLLNEKQTKLFLQGPWTARLACIRPDGNPHVIPVWQEWDGRVFHVLAWHGSQWADFVRKNPQVSLTIDEPWPPLRRVVCRGKAVETQEPVQEERSALIGRLAQRYLGKNAPLVFQREIESVFTITPENLRGWQGLSSGESG
jgi:DNA-binding IclR family transcriptional regulator/nitroimidazol reductase NimA-like FMN-containing flavoprotein (pyridoxamine 5'-phosphate oxidase superfamily)